MERDEGHQAEIAVGAHTRTVRERPVTFTCRECGETVTESRRPGPTPRYCNPCWPSVQAARSAERVRRYRERRAARTHGDG